MRTVLLCLVALLLSCSDQKAQLLNGESPPSFALSNLSGQTIHFPQDLSGKVVVIRFWADWCPFCKTEMKEIQPVYQKYESQGLEILAINVRQDQETAARFIDKLGISYSTLLDSEGTVARSYGVTALPSSFFIDRNGKLVARLLGEATAETFEKIVAPLL